MKVCIPTPYTETPLDSEYKYNIKFEHEIRETKKTVNSIRDSSLEVCLCALRLSA